MALLFGLFVAPDASAYIDPGSGALLLQAAISGFVGLVFIARRWIKRVILFVRSCFWRTQASPD